ncbi:methyltransferase-like protein 25B [Macrosteles quadrilineatus]|uniref:methyltransferase-like protein 25B n=1 Tax=Macrosteles quadrilineatus TaxID=74068 RepID=UPI0023E2ED80|nr:methyltransferase-like protein 25B [Macrosteles quadrilineatus]
MSLLIHTQEFSEYFRNVSQFLQEFSWIYKTPVTNLLTQDVFSKIPNEWKGHILDLSIEELNEVPLGFIKDSSPRTLQNFIRNCKELTLPELAGLPLNLPSCSDDWLQSVPKEIWKGMSQKKKQEVQLMSAFVHNECKALGISNIVDLGSGLGYVNRLLLLQGYKILGVESQEKLVNFATTLKDKIFPSEIAMKISYINLNICENSIPELRNALVKTLITPYKGHRTMSNYEDNEDKNNFNQKENFTKCRYEEVAEGNGKVCMIGLHACGDLAVSGLKMFLNLPEVSALVMIPCCYHKMALDSNVEVESGVEKFHNIPQSQSLAKACAEGENFICRSLLRLASQGTNSSWMSWSAADHRQHSFNVLARAVVELYAQKENASFKKNFRRLARKSLLKDQNFSNYISEILSRSEMRDEDQMTDFAIENEKIHSELLCLWELHQDKLPLVEVITVLQMCLEPVVESLVVADRICFLREQNINNVRIVRIIDNRISPRSLAYIASK